MKDEHFNAYLHSTLVEEGVDPFSKCLFLYRKPLILQSPYSAFFKIMVIVLLVKEVWVPTHGEPSDENTTARDKLSTNSLCLDFDLLLLLIRLGRSGSGAGAGKAHFTGNNSDSPTGFVSHHWSIQQRLLPKAQSF